jgi:NAD(P)-dependent dehydrogenase (short-subunit alcohol dehydrogenase family)
MVRAPPSIGRLEGEIAIVAGSGRGIGAGVALRFVREGSVITGAAYLIDGGQSAGG